MEVQVIGGTTRAQRLVVQAVQRVDSVLAGNGTVSVQITRQGFADGVSARANESGIALHPVFAFERHPLYVQYLLYEEATHFIATQRGLPSSIDPMSVLLQELVAGYVQQLLVETHHPDLLSRLEFSPPPSDPYDPMVPYNIGKQIGLELMGAGQATRHLDSWLASTAPTEWREMVPVLRAAFSESRNPDQVLEVALLIDSGARSGQQ
jgi:hypothetical protein